MLTTPTFPCARRRLEAAVDDAIADKEQAQALVEAERMEVGQTTGHVFGSNDLVRVFMCVLCSP